MVQHDVDVLHDMMMLTFSHVDQEHSGCMH